MQKNIDNRIFSPVMVNIETNIFSPSMVNAHSALKLIQHDESIAASALIERMKENNIKNSDHVLKFLKDYHLISESRNPKKDNRVLLYGKTSYADIVCDLYQKIINIMDSSSKMKSSEIPKVFKDPRKYILDKIGRYEEYLESKMGIMDIILFDDKSCIIISDHKLDKKIKKFLKFQIEAYFNDSMDNNIKFLPDLEEEHEGIYKNTIKYSIDHNK